MSTKVVVAGAGPVGLLLACELRLAGVADVVVLDRLAKRTGESRASGIHARTIEILDQRGIAERFLAAGRPLPAGHFSGLRLDFSRFKTRYPYALVIVQAAVERLLEQRAAELGVEVQWSAEVTGVEQNKDGVAVDVRRSTGTDRIHAAYLAGCDGGRSSVRKAAGIGFPGTPGTVTAIVGDVELREPPTEQVFMERREHGTFTVFGVEPGWFRVMTTEYDRPADRNAAVDFDELRQAMVKIAGTDFGMHNPRWMSRFGDAARQAERYRVGRVLLAGDAAHIHFPSGGQGLNLGMQDAVNLGWKLAAVLAGHAPETLLDTYHTERYPVAERVVQSTRAQVALATPGEQTKALRDVFAGLIKIGDVNHSLGEMIAGLDIRYPIGDGHPMVGRRVPDIDLETSGGSVRLFTLLHAARPILLELGGTNALATIATDWPDRVAHISAVTQNDHMPRALLIRPDGYIAWAASPDGAIEVSALRSALVTWCGFAQKFTR